MELQALEKHIKRLASLDGTRTPIVSCYLDLGSDDSDWRTFVSNREAEILGSLKPTSARSGIRGVFNSIKRWLNSELLPDSRGAAIIARGREGDVFVPMQFQVPLPNEIAIDSVPHLYHLLRMKDSHNRYVVLYSDSHGARIYEVSLGALSDQMTLESPDLPRCAGREWTMLHYKRRRAQRERLFLKQKIDLLDKLIDENPQTHLMLAGDSTCIDQITRALPRRIVAKLVDQVVLARSHSAEKIVMETLKAYVKAEEIESLNTVDRLFDAFYRGDHAVLGVATSLRAASRGQADTLVLRHGVDLGTARICSNCSWVATGESRPNVCSECGGEALLDRDARQELVRVAQSTQCEIETVAGSERLADAGGAGCLLRYADAPSERVCLPEVP
ncbi:MAG: hypothetical protein GY867_08380 [bacterium]|nr:hypothetical protein [bacterium]